MPAYLVKLANLLGKTLPTGKSSVVVFAADVADARSVCKGQFDGDSDAIWDAATVTEVVAGADAASMDLRVAILDSSPVVDLVATGVLGGQSAVVAAGGTGYSVNDILTLTGGTSTRAATFRVTGDTGGVIDDVELVDAGEYTVFPTSPVSTSGGGGSSATLTVTSGADGYANLFGEMVGLLNAESIIAGSLIDMGATPPLLTISDVADGLGDKQVVAEMRYGGSAVASMLATIVDEGIAAAVLTVEAVAAPVLPKVEDSF